MILNNLGKFSGSNPSALIAISVFISKLELGIASGFFLPEESGFQVAFFQLIMI